MIARRAVLWGLLVAALVAVAAAGVWEIVSRPEPPPVLGTVPDFTLTNRDGRTIRQADLAGSPWVADFIFTRCAGSCPMMSLRMARLGRELPAELPAGLPVRLVSFSVDPDSDTPAVLERYAESFKAPARWLFLTGPRDAMHRLSKEGFKLAVDAGGSGEEPILHSTRFVLVDGQGRIRGYYEAFDEPSMKRLRRDLVGLVR